MWPFTSRKKLLDNGFFNGFTDWHSHILPGVDDGVGTLDESLAILADYEAAGVKAAWLTPHVMEDIANTPQQLIDRFNQLKAAYQGPVALYLAAENMLDNLFEERLRTRQLLPIGLRGDHLLVETSYFTPPSDMDDKLQRLRMAGYFPVLAHPERYIYMDDDDYEYLHSNDIKFQLNLGSLLGFYGPEPEKKANYILNKGYYHLIGTDTHRLTQVQAMMRRGALTTKTIQRLRQLPGIE